MRIYNSMEEMIGNTPMLALDRLAARLCPEVKLLAKLEYLNPAGSVKDRVAKAMLDDAEEKGLLKPGSVIIEPTSGNTGIGLAAVAAARGYRVIIVMPESMSLERRRLMAAYGAELVLTPAREGMGGAIARAKELAAKTPGSFIPGQFTNPANPEAHRRHTAREIYEATNGEVDIFVGGVGTGGTITGAGSYLKSKKPEIKIVAVEPAESPVLSGGLAGPHKIQGIGAGFKPGILDMDVIDEIIPIDYTEAASTARQCAASEGLLTGISSGAALAAAARLGQREENNSRKIVVLLPDSGERYLSTGLFEC